MKVINVNQDNFEKEVLSSLEPVLIDFNAEWCGPCRMLKPIIEEVAIKNSRVKFVSINVDNDEDLARRYGVMSIPTLILMQNGREIKRNVGLISRDEIEKFIGE